MKKSGAVLNSPSTKLSYSIKKIRQPACPSSKPKRLSEFDSDEEHPKENAMVSRIKGLEEMMEKLIHESIAINKTIGEMAMKSTSPIKADEQLLSEPKPLNENGIIERKKVSKKEYATTSNSVRACFAANRITNITTNSFQKMEVIRGSLGTTGLESILDGYRTEPVVTKNNPFGFIERRILNVEVMNDVGEKSMKEIMLDDDDKFYFAHDQGRLYQAMMEIFDDSLYYLVKPEIKEKNGYKMYIKIMEHLNGQRAKDAERARKQFTNYVMDESLSFKLEHYRFTEIINTLEYAQKKKIDDVDKMDFLYTRLILDRRIGLKEVMIQAKLDNYDYDKTIEKLIEINMDTPDGIKNVRIKAMTTENKKYCFAFNSNNTCKFGTSCRYLHEKDPNPNHTNPTNQTQSSTMFSTESPKKKFHKNTNENKTSVPSIGVTKEHRSVYEPNVGLPSGVKSEKNPLGWSLKQISARKIIMKNLSTESIKSFNIQNDNGNSTISDNITSEGNFSSWGDTSSDVYNPNKNNENEITMKVMSISETNEEFLEEHDDIVFHTSTFIIMLWGLLFDFLSFCTQIYSIYATPANDFVFKCVRQCMLQIVSDSTSAHRDVSEIEVCKDDTFISTYSTRATYGSEEANESEDDDSSNESIENENNERHNKFIKMSIYSSMTHKRSSIRKIKKMNNNENELTSVKEKCN